MMTSTHLDVGRPLPHVSAPGFPEIGMPVRFSTYFATPVVLTPATAQLARQYTAARLVRHSPVALTLREIQFAVNEALDANDEEYSREVLALVERLLQDEAALQPLKH